MLTECWNTRIGNDKNSVPIENNMKLLHEEMCDVFMRNNEDFQAFATNVKYELRYENKLVVDTLFEEFHIKYLNSSDIANHTEIEKKIFLLII